MRERPRPRARLAVEREQERQRAQHAAGGVDAQHREAPLDVGVTRCVADVVAQRAVGADDWNDDWVDNMERWGNARAAGFWEERAPVHRPSGNAAAAAKRRAEYLALM